MPFSEIIGQDRAVGALRAALERGALHHAYLFGGPEGVGKGTAARLLAQAGNCERVTADSCGACGPCRKIARGLHPDVIVLSEERVMAKAGRWEPKGGRTPSADIVVDQIRDLVDHRLSMRRFEGRRRFVIIDPADAMNPQAQNALLKTLEEPPGDTTFVLVAESPDSLLPTIRSRCARVPFAPPPQPLVPDAEALEERRELVQAAARLDPDDASTWVAFAREHGDDREGARQRCELLALWLRDVLACQVAGAAAPLALPELAEQSRALGAVVGPEELLRRIEHALSAAAALRQNAAPALALERMLIGWFHGDVR